MPGIFGSPNIQKMKETGDIQGLIKTLGSQKDKKLRDDASAALVELGQKGPINDLAKALDHKDPNLRVKVVLILAETKQPWVIPALNTALHDDDPEVRANAAYGLGNFQSNQTVVDPLVTCLVDKDMRVRRAGISTLAALQAREAVQPLCALLKSSDLEMRQEAASALRTMADPQAVKPLIGALSDQDRIVRQYSAEALGNIGDPEAYDALTYVAEHDPYIYKNPLNYAISYPVRKSANTALRKLEVEVLDANLENLAGELLRLFKEYSRAWEFHSAQYVFDELNQSIKNIEEDILAEGGKARMQLVARRVMQIARGDPVFYEKFKHSHHLKPWL